MNNPAAISFEFTPSALRDEVLNRFIKKQRIKQKGEYRFRVYKNKDEISQMLTGFSTFFTNYCLKTVFQLDSNLIASHISSYHSNINQHIDFIENAVLSCGKDGTLRFEVIFKSDLYGVSYHMHALAEQLISILTLHPPHRPTIRVINGPYLLKLESKNLESCYSLWAVLKNDEFSSRLRERPSYLEL